jgi:hypothetical protein
MDTYVASYVFLLVIITGIVYLFIAAMAAYGIESAWYKGLNKSDVEITINSYFFLSLYFIVALLPYLVLWTSTPLILLLLIGALISLFWIVVFFVGQSIEVSVWLTIPVFLYYLWLFSRVWIYNPAAAALLIPMLIFIIFMFYHVVHLAFINNIML